MAYNRERERGIYVSVLGPTKRGFAEGYFAELLDIGTPAKGLRVWWGVRLGPKTIDK